ncbi:MAG: hypothetical protein MJ137_03795, partial [Clostridia bacterium]|nr:hypothetical protein [Clostridia bacterium]
MNNIKKIRKLFALVLLSAAALSGCAGLQSPEATDTSAPVSLSPDTEEISAADTEARDTEAESPTNTAINDTEGRAMK